MIQKLFYGAVAFSLLLPAPLMAAGEMTAGEFLAKAEKLKAQGPLALMSSDLTVLKNEGKRASKVYKDDIVRQKKSGQIPHSCPPEGGSMNADELINHLKSLSAAQKQQPFRSAFYGLMKKKYPCK